MESFVYQYPVKNYFGEGAAVQALTAELPRMGERVMLAYGGGSVKRSGLYDQVVALLEQAGKTVVDFGGIMSNPTYEKVQEGARIARENAVDFILAVGAAARSSTAARSSRLRPSSTRTSMSSSTCRADSPPRSSRWAVS